MAAPFHTEKGLIQSQHKFFLYLLRGAVNYKPAVLLDGQRHENTYCVDGTQVAVSDTDRNTKTDKMGKRTSWGTITIDFIATDPQRRGKGGATHQLNALGKLADKWNITLRLRPMAHDSSPLNDEQLSAWYQRLGYTGTDGLYLTRLPLEQRNKARREALAAGSAEAGASQPVAVALAA